MTTEQLNDLINTAIIDGIEAGITDQADLAAHAYGLIAAEDSLLARQSEEYIASASQLATAILDIKG